MTLFMWLLAEKIPAASDSMSKLGIFFNALTVAMVAMVFGMSFVSSMHHKRIGDKSIPKWLRMYVFEFLAYKLGVRYDGGENQKKKNKSEKIDSKNDIKECVTECFRASFNKMKSNEVKKTGNAVVTGNDVLGDNTMVKADKKEDEKMNDEKVKNDHEKTLEPQKTASFDPSINDLTLTSKNPPTAATNIEDKISARDMKRDSSTAESSDKKKNVQKDVSSSSGGKASTQTLLELSLKKNDDDKNENFYDSKNHNNQQGISSVRETALIGNLSTDSVSSNAEKKLTTLSITSLISDNSGIKSKTLITAVDAEVDDDDVFDDNKVNLSNENVEMTPTANTSKVEVISDAKMCDSNIKNDSVDGTVPDNVGQHNGTGTKVDDNFIKADCDAGPVVETGNADNNKITNINDKEQDKVDHGTDTKNFSIDKSTNKTDGNELDSCAESTDKSILNNDNDSAAKLTEEKTDVARPMPRLRNVGLHLMMNKRRNSSNNSVRGDNNNDLSALDSSKAQKTLFPAMTRSPSSTSSKLKMTFQQVAGCAMESLAKRKNELMEEKLAKERHDKRFNYEWRMCAETIDRMFTILFVSVFVIAALWIFHEF